MEELARGAPYHLLESQLSPDLHAQVHTAPKPMERSGCWCTPKGDFTGAHCLDVVGCHANALLEKSVGLPTCAQLAP